jgi:hypothetical protein
MLLAYRSTATSNRSSSLKHDRQQHGEKWTLGFNSRQGPKPGRSSHVSNRLFDEPRRLPASSNRSRVLLSYCRIVHTRLVPNVRYNW